MAVHLSSIQPSGRYHDSQLQPGFPTAHAGIHLPLLPPGPDGVHECTLRRTQSSSPLIAAGPHKTAPRTGIPPCSSGLQVQGTATSPSSTAKFCRQKMAERVGFEPTRQRASAYSLSRRAPSTGLGHLSSYDRKTS